MAVLMYLVLELADLNQLRPVPGGQRFRENTAERGTKRAVEPCNSHAVEQRIGSECNRNGAMGRDPLPATPLSGCIRSLLRLLSPPRRSSCTAMVSLPPSCLSLVRAEAVARRWFSLLPSAPMNADLCTVGSFLCS
jgi:hypothetical protein